MSEDSPLSCLECGYVFNEENMDWVVSIYKCQKCGELHFVTPEKDYKEAF